ncbi:hypothetical protein J1N35_040790, partial [Gossypium stocksii]
MVDDSSGDDSDDEREIKEILQRMKSSNRLFVVVCSSLQLYYEKFILKQRYMDSKQSAQYPNKYDCIDAIDGTHITAILPPNEQLPTLEEKVSGLKMEGSSHDTRIFLDVIRDPKYKFSHPPNGKYYLVDSGYPQMK